MTVLSNAPKARDAVTIALAEEIHIGRGDIFATPTNRPEVADRFAAHIIWMDHDALSGAFYCIRLGKDVVSATITNLKYEIDVNTRDHPAAKTFDLTEIGFCRPRCLQLTPSAK